MLDPVRYPVELVNCFPQIVDRNAHLGEHLDVAGNPFEVGLNLSCMAAKVVELGLQVVRAIAHLAIGHFLQHGSHDIQRSLRRVPAGQGVFELVADLRESGFVDHEFAGQIHQLVQALDIHTQRLGRLGRGVGRAGLCGSCRGRLLGLCLRPSRLRPSRSRLGSRLWRHRFCLLGRQRLDDRLPNPGNSQATGNRGLRLLREDAETDAVKVLQFVETFRGRIEEADITQIGKLLVDQPSFQPDQRQQRIENHGAGKGLVVIGGRRFDLLAKLGRNFGCHRN